MRLITAKIDARPLAHKRELTNFKNSFIPRIDLSDPIVIYGCKSSGKMLNVLHVTLYHPRTSISIARGTARYIS